MAHLLEQDREVLIVQQQQQQQQKYIRLVREQYGRKSFIPSFEIKYELGTIRQKLLQQKQKVIVQLREQRVLEETIGEEQLGRYYAKKKQAAEYSLSIQLVKRIKHIYTLIEQDIVSNSLKNINGVKQDLPQKQLTQQTNKHLQHQQQTFAKLIQLIEQFNIFYTEQYQSINKDNKQDQTIHQDSHQNTKLFANNFLSSILQKVLTKRESQQQQISNRINQILKRQNLPVRRNQKPHQRNTTKITPTDKLFIQRILHSQACQFALYTYITSLLTQRTTKLINSQKINEQKQYTSLFFSLYFSKLMQSVSYLFIQQNESHSFLQPNWMFEYIQQVFVGNYQWLRDNVLNNMGGQAQGNILVYLLQYNVNDFFFNNIKKRLQTDLKDEQFRSKALHFYKFLDSLYEMQQKMSISFSQQFSFIQNLLVQFQIKRRQEKFNILQKCFEYQHQWIEEKIFKDFWQNINYSSIDLKNIQTYNIVVNFNVLFQKLYTKFSSLYELELIKKIFSFYQQQIRNLVAHIKTSLERIYYHSGLDKLSVILAFKRVDNEFRSGLSLFISKDLSFEKEIKRQYYDYILQLFTELTVQQLNVYSRKLLKAVTELQHLFTAQTISQEDHSILINRSQQIYRKWSIKLQQLNLVYPIKDQKIKNQFFVFLQSIKFTSIGTYFLQHIQIGITIFLQFYQPFLKVYYNSEIFNILKMVILMDKKQQLNFLKTGNITNFLLQTEINAIKKIKII